MNLLSVNKPRSKKRFFVRGKVFSAFILLSTILIISLGSCFEPMPEGRGAPSKGFVTPDSRDFGTEVYHLLLREAEIHTTLAKVRVAGVRALNQEWTVASTINRVVPKTALSSIEAFMQRLLPMYDDDAMPSISRNTAKILREASLNTEFLQSFVLIGKREGFFHHLIQAKKTSYPICSHFLNNKSSC